MVESMIMVLGSIVFAVLFTFLMFVLASVVISLFRKTEYPDYEPEVSVIIPCYNEESNIKNCLDAVYSLDYPQEKMEVIVVDDGSTDNTLDVLKKLKKEHSNLIIARGKHEGKSESLTIGA